MRRYESLGEIAVGGMATVHLARIRRDGRFVAVKDMHQQVASDPELAKMFADEARLTSRLRHPNIVATLDVVVESDRLQLVMEYVDGASLASLGALFASRGERMPVAYACAIVRDVLLGLHHAHEATDDDGEPLGVVHRDVSPQNVMLGVDGCARVLDFGIAKTRRRLHETTGEGIVKGKLAYMPPEQMFGEAIDRRVDVYAAGVVLWEALCGRRLFAGAAHEIAAKVEQGAPPPPSMFADFVGRELDVVVLRALSASPDDRYATAREMADAISRAVALPTRAQMATWVRRVLGRSPPPAARRAALSFHHVAMAIGVAGLALAALAFARGDSSNQSRGNHDHDSASYAP